MKSTGKMKKVLLILLSLALMLSLTGCGGLWDLLGDESDRIAAYIQGYLDLTYKGQFNEDYMEELDLTEEDMQERYESGLRAEAQFFENAIGYIEYPTEESTSRLMDIYAQIYSYSDYTVESCTKLESGNYAVEVSFRPIDTLTKLNPEQFNQVFVEVLGEFGVYDDEDLANMSEEDYIAADGVYAQRIMDLLEQAIPGTEHGEERSVVVQIKDAGNIWEPVQSDVDIIDYYLIDYSSFGY